MPIWSKPKQSATLGRLATQPMPPGLPGIKETPTGPSSTGDSTEDAGALNDTGSPILPLASGQSGKRRRPRKSRAASGRDEPLPPPLAAQPMPPGLPDLGIKETPTGPSSTEDSTEDAGALDEAGSPSLPLASGQSRKRRRPMLPLAAQPMPPGLPDSGIKETPTGPSPTGDAGALNDAGSPSLPLASGQSGQRRRPRKSRTASGRDEPMPPPPPPLAVQQPSSSVARHDSSAPAAPVEDKSRRLTKELRWLRKLNGPAMDMILAQTSPTADGPAHPRPPRRAASGPRPGVEGPGSVSQLQDGAGHDETPSEAAAEVGAPADQVTDAPPSPPAPRPGVEELESVSQLQDGAGHDEAPSEAGHEETPSEAAAEVGAPADQVTDAPPSPPAPRPGVEELESVRQLQDGAGHEETPSKAAAEVGAPADQVTDAPPSPPAPRPGVKELESVSQLQDGAGHDEAPSEAAAEVGALPANQVTDAPPSPPAPRPGVEELESVRQLQDGAGHDEAPSEAAAEVGASPDQVTDAPPSPPAPSTQQHPPVASPAKPARRTAPASKPQTPRHASRAIKVPSSRRSILSLVSFADDDADEGDIDELGRSLAGATPSAPFVSSGASRKIWKSSARTTEIYHTPVKRRATDVLSPGSIIKTPGGTLRACGIAGFRCGRDFCFTCL
ncbi:hypothetical protein G6O67_008480 [Ophiocordyceps sinensis]|nr:hypothetical protein G6O67_008480 [Ophiocordyceps sinensis]